MKIFFDPAFDGGHWPRASEARSAVAGELWLGSTGLLGQLELRLGLGGPRHSNAVRAAALLPALQTIQGFWSASAEVDPLGTAHTLLQWRDVLWLHGWRGEALGWRLSELSAVTKEVLAGFADRLEAVRGEVAIRDVEIDKIFIFHPITALPQTWRLIFEALARSVRVEEIPISSATAIGDLMSARDKNFIPTGDGTLQLLRPHGPMQAAEEAAAWLAAQDSLQGTVVIGSDPVLDQALHRHGLPTTGAPAPLRENALLQVLPLVLAMGWNPPDPQRALELLMLPQGPVPPGLARRLSGALQEFPAVDSDLWRIQINEGLAAIEDEKRRDVVKQRLAKIFSPSSEGQAYATQSLQERAMLVLQWLQGRLKLIQDAQGDETPWCGAIQQCAEFLAVINLIGQSSVSMPLLQRLLNEAADCAGETPVLPAQAGLACVARPECIVGEARRIIWWGFTRESVIRPTSPPLSRSERAALANAGIALPDPGQEAIWASQRWRRPLLHATTELLLVCPSFDKKNEECWPHPLWDELTAQLSCESDAARLTVKSFADKLPREVRTWRPTPTARRHWFVPEGAISPRDAESPSGMEMLIKCPFSWSLKYSGGLQTGAGAQLPDVNDATFRGNFAHWILERLMIKPPSSAEDAAREAERIFNLEGPRLAAAYFQPGNEVARTELCGAIVASMRRLFTLLVEQGMTIKLVETSCEAHTPIGKVRGRTDLVLSTSKGKAIIDFKSGLSKTRQEALESGTACQLAAYAHLLQDGTESELPAVAYFMIPTQSVLTPEFNPIPGVRPISGPPIQETWKAACSAYQRALQVAQGGAIDALGAPGDGEDETPAKGNVLAEGNLTLATKCNKCDFAALCGAQFGGVA